MNPVAGHVLRMIAALCILCVAIARAKGGCDGASCAWKARADVRGALRKLEREWGEWSVMGSPDDHSRTQAAYFLGVLYGRLGVEVPSWWAEILVRRAIGAKNVANVMEIDEKEYTLTGNFRHPRSAKITVVNGRIVIQDARATFSVPLDDVANVKFASEGVLPFVMQYAIDVKRKRAVVLVYHPALPPPSGWIKGVDIERSAELWSSSSVGDFQLGEKRKYLELSSGVFTSGCQLIMMPCGCVLVFGARNEGLYVQLYDRDGKTVLARLRYPRLEERTRGLKKDGAPPKETGRKDDQ